MDRQQLQREIEELQKQWDLLSEKLSKLKQAAIIETKPEEIFRLEKQIADIETKRQQIEGELNDLEVKLKEDIRPALTKVKEKQETLKPVKEKQLWDIFISHASEDKDEIAEPLAKALQQAGLRVWYNEFILKPGDSFSDSIRIGQNNSTYALIILSPNFFGNEKWAKHELKGFMTREVYEGKTIIPVWHKVTLQDVRRFAPDLADKKAVSTSEGLDAVVQQILSVFSEKEKHFREKEKPAKQAKATQQPQRTPRAPVIQEPLHLRSEPLIVSEGEARKVFGLLAEGWERPLEYVENDYEDQGDVVMDHATGLMWQKSGSKHSLTYEEAQAYVDKLNREQFAGYSDWRLPTIPELLSLMEPEEKMGITILIRCFI